MRYAFIKAHRSQWAVSLMAQVLAVSLSGFYSWLKRSQSQRAQDDEVLTEKITMFHRGELGPLGPGFARSRVALLTARRASIRIYVRLDTK